MKLYTITVTLLLLAVLFVGYQQNATLVQQRNLIVEMTKNPGCLNTPVPIVPRPKRILVTDN